MMLGSDCIGVMLKFLIEEGNFLLWPIDGSEGQPIFSTQYGEKRIKEFGPFKAPL